MPGVDWPAFQEGTGAMTLAIQYELEASQWWPREEIAQRQLHQIGALLRHAAAGSPFWRERLRDARVDPREPLTEDAFVRIPVLTRSQVQAQGPALRTEPPEPRHGSTFEARTSGSTAMPVTIVRTGVSALVWNALTTRDHLWHRRDFGATLAVIRSGVKEQIAQGWGPSWHAASPAGRVVVQDIAIDTDRQLDWLCGHTPAYLLTYGSALRALATRSIERGIRLPGLREARSFGESVDDDLRERCRAAWGVPMTDLYSAEEVGNIALQCPDHPHYHAQSEAVRVEVLDAAGRPCPPGTIGQVVVTALHSHAMPLVRYALGDYAEAGEACPCGRGLPVLRRILGRQRNMLRLPDGRWTWPIIKDIALAWEAIAGVQQLQLVQVAATRIEARFVAPSDPSPDVAARMIAALDASFGKGFDVALQRVAALERSRNYKFEDFQCRIDDAAPPLSA
jgi:phenylacetate-CoA ligase